MVNLLDESINANFGVLARRGLLARECVFRTLIRQGKSYTGSRGMKSKYRAYESDEF